LEGVRQAQLLAARFASSMTAGVVGAVLTSRAARAIQTGELVARALGTPTMESTCDLCEMHPGEAEGLTYAEMAERFGRTYADVPGAEYFPDWLPRATNVLRELTERKRGRTVLAVTHNAVIKASFVAFGRMPAREAEVVTADNTGITTWVCPLVAGDRRTGIWRLDRHNDTSHLARAGLDSK
jgi:broad specificity phosphatase PhoE